MHHESIGERAYRVRRSVTVLGIRFHGTGARPDRGAVTILLTLAGFVLLLLGGEAVVRGAIRLAPRMNVSPLMIGIVVVGFGTALPELAVSIDAALRGSPGLAVGNVIGSNIANSMMVLGIAAVIYPVVVDPRALRRDTVALIGSTLAFTGIGFFVGQITWWHGAMMVSALGVYITWTVRRDTGFQASGQGQEAETQPRAGTPPAPASFLLLAAGLAAVLIGAECVVRGAVRLATELGVSEEVIGLTLIALGTSLPEIATSFVAAWRGRTELCLGNVIGSNLFNILGIAGVTALVAPLPFAERIIDFDLWFLLGTTAFMVLAMMASRRIGRLGGLVLSATYCAYIMAQFTVTA